MSRPTYSPKQLLNDIIDPLPFDESAKGEAFNAALHQIVEHMDDQTINEACRQAITHLNERTAKILTLHYGLEGNHPQSLKKIGEGLGVGYATMRHSKIAGIRKLRDSTAMAQYFYSFVSPIAWPEYWPCPASLISRSDLLSFSVDWLQMHFKTTNVLKASSINFIHELVRCNDAFIAGLDYSGKTTLAEIKEALSKIGLHLGMKLPDPQYQDNDFMLTAPITSLGIGYETARSITNRANGRGQFEYSRHHDHPGIH